jgi:hypothetical protein
MDPITAAAFAASAIVVGYATWWLVRHEVAVRRLRALSDRSTGSN